MKYPIKESLLSAAMLGALLLCGTASAHHSTVAFYDSATVTELEGEIVRFVWANPHVRFTIRVRDSRGQEELWDIETNSVSILGRMGLSANIVKVGDRVKVAGNPAKNSQRAMFAEHLLLRDGREIVLAARRKPRWSDRTVGTSGPWLADTGNTSDPQRGIFRVWSRTNSSSPLFPGRDPGLALKTYPLTERARAAFLAFDPIKDSPLRDCTPKGMPTIMSNPYPLEFVKQGDNILLRMEEYDTLRTIHMNTEAPRVPPRSPVGYSVGRWDGTTLVVTTKGISWTHFDQFGVPLSERTEIVELFTPSADGSRLDYRMTVTDPLTFTEPVVLQKFWIWLPEAEVRPYKCTPG